MDNKTRNMSIEIFEVGSDDDMPTDCEELDIHSFPPEQRARIVRSLQRSLDDNGRLVGGYITVESSSDEESSVSEGDLPDNGTDAHPRRPSTERPSTTDQGQAAPTLRDSPPGSVQEPTGSNTILPEGGNKGPRDQPSDPGPARKRARPAIGYTASNGPDTSRRGPAGGSD